VLQRSVAAAGTPGGTFTVEGAVLAEILVLLLDGADIRLTGPCGAEPWLVEVGDADPTDVVAAMARKNLGEPLLVHSTSWRRDRGAVILTFACVVPPGSVPELAAAPVHRADLSRGGATSAAARIGWEQVLEHALRHLAWLYGDDAVVADALGEAWREPLATYTPEPFRAL